MQEDVRKSLEFRKRGRIHRLYSASSASKAFSYDDDDTTVSWICLVLDSGTRVDISSTVKSHSFQPMESVGNWPQVASQYVA